MNKNIFKISIKELRCISNESDSEIKIVSASSNIFYTQQNGVINLFSRNTIEPERFQLSLVKLHLHREKGKGKSIKRQV